MFYKVQKQLIKIDDIEKELKQQDPRVIVGTYNLAKTSHCSLVDKKYYPIIHEFNRLRFSKAELYEDVIIGSLAIPKKVKENKNNFLSFYITKHCLLFFDNTPFTKEILEKLEAESTYEHCGVGHVFFRFLQMITEDDLLYMEDMENYMTDLEEQAVLEDIHSINPIIMNLRKKSFVLYRYYSQMIHLIEKLLEKESRVFTESERKLFQLFRERCEQFLSETAMLQEYARQVREVYQYQIDIKQNSIMRVLTVVTTIFMPLTLITGWYGMNFENMPELVWKYGYLTIIILSISVVLFCIWLFKKKKYF